LQERLCQERGKSGEAPFSGKSYRRGGSYQGQELSCKDKEKEDGLNNDLHWQPLKTVILRIEGEVSDEDRNDRGAEGPT